MIRPYTRRDLLKLPALLLALPKELRAAYALVAHVSAGSANANSITTAGVNTTGADFITLCVTNVSGTASTVSDSKANTWTLAKRQANAGNQQTDIWFSPNPTVGAAHTFTVNNTGSAPSIFAAAFSGSLLVSPLDGAQVNGATSGGASVTTLATGSVTPSQNSDLIVTLLGGNNDIVSGPATIDSGFTIIENVSVVGGQHFGGALAYLIQGAHAAVNPNWGFGAATQMTASIACFKAAVAGVNVVPRKGVSIVG